MRDIADESRQRLEARAQETAPPTEEPQPDAQPSLSNSDDIPDWLREITAQATPAPDAASTGDAAQQTAGDIANGADDTPSWLHDQPSAPEQAAQPGAGEAPTAQPDRPEDEVVDGQLLAVEVAGRSDETGAGETNIPALTESKSEWSIDDGSSLATPLASGMAEKSHARVYDVPADSIWSAQPDRPAPDGSTGQETPVWATPDETARAIVEQPDAFELPSWLEDDDIEPTPDALSGRPEAASGAWSPPSWLDNSDVDRPPARQQSATWAPPSWLDDDDNTLPAAGYGGSKSRIDDGGGGVAVAGATAATAAAAQTAARPVEGQSAELLQRLLAEPAPETAAAPSRGGGTMLIVIVVVLLVMAALVVVFAAPALGFNLF